MEVLSSLVVHPISLLYTRYITDRPGYGCLHDPDSTSTPTGSSDKVPAAISRDINEHNHSATWSTSSSTYRGSYRYKNVCDLIRQSTALPPTSSSGSSSSAFHFLHKVRRLYRGWPLGILLTIIVEPIIQVTMDGFSYLQTMRILNGNSDEGYSMNQIWFAAACLGAQAALFYIGVYAVETVRHRVMVQEDEDEGDTMEVVDHEKGGNSSQALRQKTPATGLSFYWQTAKTIVDNEGWLTLWRGFLVEFLNYPISGVAYFVPVLLTKS
ncbi:hypothetical protein BGW41_005897 [Actinomortierella wolfii]|nr:hypothetical protein BGW41_005897 [Actinomortierella wolfii]